VRRFRDGKPDRAVDIEGCFYREHRAETTRGDTMKDELTKRILALIPSHPEIMTIESAFDLFKIDGFKCDDLDPSLAQAVAALGRARKIHKDNNAAHAARKDNHGH
jgi:hypothetical protein